jgi:hypothetical protein
MATLKQLDQLAQRIPQRNAQAAKRQQAAATLQARAAVGQSSPQQSTRQAAQSVAPALTQAQAQAGQQAAQQSRQQVSQLGQQRLQQQRFQGQQALGRQGLAQQAELGAAQRQQQLELGQGRLGVQRELTQQELRQQQQLAQLGMAKDDQLFQLDIRQKQDLANLGHDLEDKLFNKRLVFDETQGQRKLSNELQLLDMAALHAEDNADLQRRLNQYTHAKEIERILLEAANKRIQQEARGQAGVQQSQRDIDTSKRISQLQRDYKETAQRNQSEAANWGNILSGAGIIAKVAITGGII